MRADYSDCTLRRGGRSERKATGARGALDSGDEPLSVSGARVDLAWPEQWDDAAVGVREHARHGGTGPGDLGRALVEVNRLERNRKAPALLAPLRALTQPEPVRDVAQAAMRAAAQLAAAADCAGRLTLRATTMWPSLPDRPTALPPA